jgi:hypothetical protein
MRFQLQPHIIILELGFGIVEPNYVLAFGIDEKVSVRVADGAIAFVDFACAFWCEGVVEGNGVLDVPAVAGAVVGS